MEFRAPLDPRAKAATAGVALLDAAILAVVWHYASTEGPMWPLYPVAALLIGIPLMGILRMPRKYIVDEGGITVQFLLGSRRFPMTGKARVRILDSPRMVKALASGGLGGYRGTYLVEGSRVTVVSGRADRLVLLESPKDKIALGPEDPEAFVEALRAVGLA